MRKSCKRRHYTPGYMLLPEQRDKIVLPVHVSLDAIESGSGEINNRHTLAAFFNIVSVCAGRMTVDRETIDQIDTAKEDLVSADHRYLRTGKWGFTGPEMLRIRHAVTSGDLILKRVNSSILVEAVNFVSRCNDKTPEVLGTCDKPVSHAIKTFDEESSCVTGYG